MFAPTINGIDAELLDQHLQHVLQGWPESGSAEGKVQFIHPRGRTIRATLGSRCTLTGSRHRVSQGIPMAVDLRLFTDEGVVGAGASVRR
ncbi:hypothetical protein GCM10009763_03630 [Dermacoccus profundi]|uniref:Uncharacterized protein n=1 Tax=Dermacoccus profundi TaxID=322602 RepID=A0ABN2CHZ5_9MICO